MSFKGIDIVRAIRSKEFLAEIPPWVEHMSVHKENLLDTVEEGRTTSVWTPGPQFGMPDGFVQGGLCSAIADGSQGIALLTTQHELEVWVTQDIHIHFVRPIKIQTPVDIETIIINKSATSALAETTFCLPEGKLAAKAIGTWRATDSRREPVMIK